MLYHKGFMISLRIEDWEHEMKWNHKLVQIAFRNYNSYVYHDTFLQLLLIEEMAKVINLSKLPLKLSFYFSDESGKLQ